MKETFLFAICLTVAAALAFYLLAMQELGGEIGRGTGVATLQQLKKMNEITLKDPDAATAKVLDEMSKVTRNDDSVRARKVATSTQSIRHSKLRRQLEDAIAKAELAVAEAEEASQEDELGASERRFLASELKQMSDDARARAEAIEQRGKKRTIREVRIGEVKAAKMRLEELRAELAKVEADEEF